MLGKLTFVCFGCHHYNVSVVLLQPEVARRRSLHRSPAFVKKQWSTACTDTWLSQFGVV